MRFVSRAVSRFFASASGVVPTGVVKRQLWARPRSVGEEYVPDVNGWQSHFHWYKLCEEVSGIEDHCFDAVLQDGFLQVFERNSASLRVHLAKGILDYLEAT